MIAGIILLLSLSAAHADAVKLQFDDISPLVTERNQHVKGANLKRRSAETSRGYLGRSFLPRLGAKAGGENYRTGSQDRRSEPFGLIEAKVNLYRGGRDGLTDEMIETKAKALGLESDQEIRGEIKKARNDFWNLVSLREQIKILEDAKTENLRNQKAAQGRIRAGLATETDKIEFDLHQVALDQDHSRLELAAKNVERQLAILIGLNEDASIQTDLEVRHEHSDQLMSSSYQVESHPVAASLSLRAEVAALETRQLNRWWMPSIDAYANYGLHTYREREYEPRSERFESVLGIQMSLEIFDGFTSRNEAKQRSLQAEGLRQESQQSTRELKAAIEASQAELKLTHELIHKSEDSLKKANQYLTRTLDEYRKGVKNSPDVLSASERNFQMKRRFAELRRDYQLARVELLSVLGK